MDSAYESRHSCVVSSNAERFGQMVLKRRTQLDLTQLEVDAAGGPSNTKQTEIEGGLLEKLLPNMAKKLDAGLRWEKGSARRTWDGGDPTPLETVAGSLEQAIAEVEAAPISEETKRYVIETLRRDRAATARTEGTA